MPIDSDGQTFTNDAFISYSRKDKEFASRLEKALEDYKPPKDLKVPQRNLVIFRDEQDITGAEYHESIKQHLNRSAKMILICSQNARGKSDNINEEIRIFAKAHGAENIFPVIISGIPNNDAKPGQEDETAFPEALCEVQETPLATDYRGFDPKKDKVNKGIYENAWYKLLADLYNLSRSEVEQREKKRQIKKRNITIGIVSGVALALSISLVWALISRSEAIEQRQIALSRQFAAEADAEFYRRPGLALALAVRAVHIRPTYEALDHLLRFVQITSTAEYILFGHKAPVVTTIFSGDGCYLASADTEGQMIVWDVKSGKPVGPPVSGNRFIFYLDPEYIAVGPQGIIAMVTRDRLLRIWDGATGNLVHEESMKDIMPNPITSLTFASQGQRIVMSSKDGSVLWWDVQKRIPMGGPVKEHDAPVNVAAFSKDGKFFATGDRNGRVVIWDGNKVIPMLRIDPEEKGGALAVTSLAFSEDDRLLAWARVDNKIIVWDVKNRSMYTKPIWNMSGHQEPIVSIAFRGNGQSLLSIGLDGHFIEWALPPRRFQMNSTRMPWPQGSKYALSVDGKGVIAWGAGNMVIWGTDIRIPPIEKVNLSKPGTTEAASLSQDGQRIAFKLRDGTIVIQDMVEGKSGYDIKPEGGRVITLAWSTNEHLALATEDGKIRIWDSAVHQWISDLRWQKGPIIRLIFSPDGKRLAAAGREELFSLLKAENDSLKELSAPKPLKEPSNESEVITTLAFSPKGKLLALGDNGGSVGIWDLGTNKWFAEPTRAHPRAVHSIVFSPNGKWVASGCLEGYVVLWDVERGKQLGGPLKVLENRVQTITFNSDGKRLIAADMDGNVAVWNVDAELWIKRACQIAQPTLSEEEWRRLMGDQPYPRACD